MILRTGITLDTVVESGYFTAIISCSNSDKLFICVNVDDFE